MSTTFTDEEVASLFPVPVPYVSEASPPALSKLVALPQVTASFDAPFIRAYPPSLSPYGITPEDWMSFTDGLNMAMIGSPPLAVVNKVGMVIGFVPNEWCMVAGAVMQVSAQTGMYVLSKTLTDKFLIRANEVYFAPRGLHVRLCKTPALRALATTTPIKKKSTLSKVGKSAKTIGLHLPLTSLLINALSAPVPKVDPYSTTDASGRRVAAFQAEGLIAELDRNVPPPKKPEGMVDKMNELGVKVERWKAAREERAVQKKRQALANPVSSSRELGLNLLSGRGRGLGGGSGRDLGGGSGRGLGGGLGRGLAGGLGGGLAGQPMRKNGLQVRVEIADRKEYNATDRLTWIVIVNADQDAIIEGREEADTQADLEVEDEEWERELTLEREEDEFVQK